MMTYLQGRPGQARPGRGRVRQGRRVPGSTGHGSSEACAAAVLSLPPHARGFLHIKNRHGSCRMRQSGWGAHMGSTGMRRSGTVYEPLDWARSASLLSSAGEKGWEGRWVVALVACLF